MVSKQSATSHSWICSELRSIRRCRFHYLRACRLLSLPLLAQGGCLSLMYPTELLLDKGYEVYGIIRRSSSFNTERVDHLYQDPHEPNTRLRMFYGDLNDSSSLNTILRRTEPDEIYNLGAQSHVRVSFDVPEYTGEVT